jgi:hypothetical protein
MRNEQWRRQIRSHSANLTAPSRSIPAVCRELGDIPSSTLYHYLHADGSLKEPGRKLLDR